MKLTDRHTFNTTASQKQTLLVLHKKYKINTSNFIRDAISEKLQREKETIFSNYKEVQKYISTTIECPF